MNFEDVLDRAAKYLAYKPRTSKQLRDHLKSRGAGQEDIARCIEMMESYHLLDDMEFTRMYIESRLASGKGMNRIRQELKQAGIDSTMIEDAMLLVEDMPDEYEMALDQARAAIEAENTAEMDHAGRQKLMGKLARRLGSRGFSTDTVYRAVRAAMDEAQERDRII